MPNTPATCPVCKKPTVNEYRPFCSRGCKDRDLLQWLGDGYRIPGPPVMQEGLDSDDEAR
ncbi:DNA gyrase inhibitor YacG [Sphingomicrobium aestuariivivum]|uniref:DNA gyrase inhibitor YacG n=1 Tax=Sphingomicrobium aestuariivivum TaxID=1582356 RepID=UPI001FD645FE|nr:DNA gyrase inhibitor YacG [Sphingomicrobium aestuariivivum]MCJ8190958.1 DNA gyrase inhibitor YacG [Sphingomicrobium aestuariivivum]